MSAGLLSAANAFRGSQGDEAKVRTAVDCELTRQVSAMDRVGWKEIQSSV